jgi:large subunit ribosomal protein L23
MDYHKIVKRPIVTEKSTQLLQQGNHYVFEVASDANKIQIARAVEVLFSVKVTKVRTFNILGKERRMGWRKGQRPSWKKAIVTLKEGQTIPVIEGV